MIPTRNTAYTSEARQQAQTSSPVQAARAVAKCKEFNAWLHTTNYRVTSAVTRLTQSTTFVCRTCKTSRQNTPGSMWRHDTAPKCLTCSFDAKTPPEYKRIGAYSTRVVLRHTCGTSKEYDAGTFLRGASYCDCLRNKVVHTPASYKHQAERARDGAFQVEQDYVNSKTAIWHRHVSGCGKRFKQTPGMFLAGTRCPACETGVVWTEAKTRSALLKKYGKPYVVSRAGKTVRSHWTLVHTTCGHSFKVVPEYLIQKAQTAVPCPFCQNAPGRLHLVRRQNKVFKLQGTEKLALDLILSKQILAKDVVHGRNGVPKIPYMYNKKPHHYYPDFHVAGLNIIVEAKDINSFGLGSWFEERVFERNCAKAKAVISSGYRFKMLVFRQGLQVQLPPRWWTLTKEALMKKLA